MSDCDFSAYGDDDASVAESVASLFDEEMHKEEKLKLINKKNEDDPNDINEKYQNINNTLTSQDKMEVYNTFKNAIFQDVSNDKMYVIRIKKI